MKTIIVNLLENLVVQFGFDSLNDFINSLIHFKLLLLTLPFSIAVFGIVEKYFGFTSAIFAAFVIMAVLELLTGIWGSLAVGKKIQSKKIGRFGLKILVWLALIFVAHAFADSYKDQTGIQNHLIYQIFTLFHGVLMVYVTFEYIISILENLGKITGKTNTKLIGFIKNKVDKFLDTDAQPEKVEEPKQEEDK